MRDGGSGKEAKKRALTFTGFNEAQTEKKTDRKTETNLWTERADFMIVTAERRGVLRA